MVNEMHEDRNGGPPRKRLLTNPNPKESFVTVSPESTVSSDSSSDRFAKKTRELPNLSDCHSCAVRINYTNPRERLQPLDSMWRVVLLCRKCIKRVKSSELCTYCFSDVAGENDCFKCGDCHHSIHKDCVAKYGPGLGFSVCVDCWVPDAIASSISVKRRKSRRKNKGACELAASSLPESNLSGSKTSETSVLGDEVERMVAAAAKASENAVRKAVAAKNAVELAKGVLSVVASTKVAGNCETKAVDDAELAFMLHRAINSSPRISRYACLMSSFRGHNAQITCYSRRRARKKMNFMSSSSLDVPLLHYSRRRRKGVPMNSTSMVAPLMCYSRRRSSIRKCDNSNLSEGIDERVCISSGGLRVSNCVSECSLNGNECQESNGGRCDMGMEPQRYLLKYHRIGKGMARPSVFVEGSDCGSCMESGNLNAEATSDTRSFGNDNECGEERCNVNTNRFLLKYEKRSGRSKLDFKCGVKDSAQFVPSSCPKESKLPNTRFQSSYQALACLGASSQG